MPPSEARDARARLAPALTVSNSKTTYVDCNAISPPTVERVAGVIAPTGCAFVDAGIIGSPPKPKADDSPRFYASGPAAPRFAVLKEYGLDVRVLEGPLSAASAVKMSYAGITKGTQALGAAMMLAAVRGGSADALLAELQESQPQMLAWLQRDRCRSCRRRPIAGWRRCMRSPTSWARTRPRMSSTGRRISTSRSRATSKATRKTSRRSRRSWTRGETALTPASGYAPSAPRTRSGANGYSRRRTPVKAATALPTAQATSGRPSSPTPVGRLSVENDLYLDVRHVGHAHHFIVGEIRLPHTAVLDDDLLTQNMAQTEDDAALGLSSEVARLHRDPGVDRGPEIVHFDLAAGTID